MTTIEKSICNEELVDQLRTIEGESEETAAEILFSALSESDRIQQIQEIEHPRLRMLVKERVEWLARGHDGFWDMAINKGTTVETQRQIQEAFKKKTETAAYPNLHDLCLLAYVTYRLGDLRETIRLLNTPAVYRKIDRDNGVSRRHQADYAFLAMAHFRLGEKEAAIENFEEFRRMYSETNQSRKERYRALAVEVEALFNRPIMEVSK